VPWGLTYTNPNTLAPLGIATQPTVVYEMFFNVAAFFVLRKLRGKFKPDGSLYLIYLSLYSAWRLGTDFLRTRNTFLLGLDQAQVISIIILLIAVSWMLKNTHRTKPGEVEPPPEQTPEPSAEATPSA
jgi:phosphatidylglycerol:prolipoprotein diacylglycerol transferase